MNQSNTMVQAEALSKRYGQTQALDLSWLVRPGTPVSSLLTGVLGIQPFPVRVEVIAWVGYLMPMALLVAWPAGRSRRRPAAVHPRPAPIAITTPDES